MTVELKELERNLEPGRVQELVKEVPKVKPSVIPLSKEVRLTTTIECVTTQKEKSPITPAISTFNCAELITKMQFPFESKVVRPHPLNDKFKIIKKIKSSENVSSLKESKKRQYQTTQFRCSTILPFEETIAQISTNLTTEISQILPSEPPANSKSSQKYEEWNDRNNRHLNVAEGHNTTEVRDSSISVSQMSKFAKPPSTAYGESTTTTAQCIKETPQKLLALNVAPQKAKKTKKKKKRRRSNIGKQKDRKRYIERRKIKDPESYLQKEKNKLKRRTALKMERYQNMTEDLKLKLDEINRGISDKNKHITEKDYLEKKRWSAYELANNFYTTSQMLQNRYSELPRPAIPSLAESQKKVLAERLQREMRKVREQNNRLSQNNK